MSEQKRTKKPVVVSQARPAGPEHQVLTLEGGKPLYRKSPCVKCPWVIEATGEFPAEAFSLSARTSYDMAKETFSCHDAGPTKPAICAGFLLRGADDNMTVRMAYLIGDGFPGVEEDGRPLHESYRAMAIANGVAEDDPVLEPCRG